MSVLFAVAACTPAATSRGRPAPAPTAQLPPADTVLAPLAFLVGDWRAADGATIHDEHWGAPAGASMIGYSRSLEGAAQVSFEFMRIANEAGTPVFLASPQGRNPPTAFPAVELSPTRVVFANDAHDFPQRIVYARRGDELAVELHGVVHGRPASQRWSYRLVPRT